MMRRPLPSRLGADRRGAAAAEMALITPLLLVLMGGAFELGKYFLDEHVVSKAVRDGARYAARQSFTNMPCGATPTADTQIKNLVRYGNIAGTGNPRLTYWVSNSTVTVAVDCPTSGAAYETGGVYNGLTGGAHRVTVSATVPYSGLFAGIGVSTTGLNVIAQSQAAVMGI
jgi:Flp pilus assembly protein TadG